MEDVPDPALIVESEPKPEDVRVLEEALNEFNVAATGIHDGKLFGLFLRGADNVVVGGAFGWTWGGTCYVRYLFVPQSLRHRGQGTRLMNAVETEASDRGCRQIVLETHDFQAPGFYFRLGFELTGRVEEYPRGHRYLTLVKRLNASESDQSSSPSLPM